MAHFQIETNDDGSVQRILRDGEPHDQSVSLEPLFSIVSPYFKAAELNIQFLEKAEERPLRRTYGMQSFVMIFTAIEAFANTYFRLQGEEFRNRQMIDRVGQRHGSLTRKIRELFAMIPEIQIEDQNMILNRLHELSQLRNALVHPQWQPASMTLAGSTPLGISGLVQNFQAAFEDRTFCREALMWCLLFVARVGRSRGNQDVSGFLFHWTGIFGLSEQQMVSELGLA